MTLIVFIVSLLGSMAIGVPVAFSLMFCGVALMWYMGMFNSQIIAQNMIAGADTFTLLAIPFWIATGLALWPEIPVQFGAALLVFLIFAGLFAVGAMGGGDVKMIGAVMLWIPLPLFLPIAEFEMDLADKPAPAFAAEELVAQQAQQDFDSEWLRPLVLTAGQPLPTPGPAPQPRPLFLPIAEFELDLLPPPAPPYPPQELADQQQDLDYDLHWHRSGEPFLTGEGRLRAAARAVIREQLARVPEENTGGGTSDARFIAPLGAEVVELGPINASIHKVNEHVAIEELERLPALYRAIAEQLLSR